jgi:hypothetical protein
MHWDRRKRAMRSKRTSYEIEKNESTFALRTKIKQSHHSLIILNDHHHVFYNIFDHRWVSLSRAQNEHEIKTSNVKKIWKSSIWEDLIVLRSFNKKTWSFWDHLTKRLDRFEICTDHSVIQTRQSVDKWRTRQNDQDQCEKIKHDKFLIKKIASDEIKRKREKSSSTICERLSSSCFYRI